MPDPVLSFSGVHKKYGKLHALKGLDFTIEPGEFVGFIGPNGAGKSTTMRAIAGLIQANEGAIEICGVDVKKHPIEARQHLGYVAQGTELYPYLTGEEFLRFVASIRGIEQATAEARIAHLLKLSTLTEAQGRLIREYSGGMARKLAIAAALLAEPALLLLDEAFVGLDPESIFRVRGALKAQVEAGAAVLLSSHVLDMVERIADRIIVLHQGRIAADLRGDALNSALQEHGDLTRLYLHLTDQDALLQEAMA